MKAVYLIVIMMDGVHTIVPMPRTQELNAQVRTPNGLLPFFLLKPDFYMKYVQLFGGGPQEYSFFTFPPCKTQLGFAWLMV